MASGPQTDTRPTVHVVAYEADDERRMQRASADRVSAKPGDQIRVSFSGPTGTTPTDLRVKIQGDSIKHNGLFTVIMAGSEKFSGAQAIEAVFLINSPGLAKATLSSFDEKGAEVESFEFIADIS